MSPMTVRQTSGATAFWRSLEELDDPAVLARLRDAWPALSQMQPALGRRDFLRLLGASLAFAGLSACSGPPPERIVPESGRRRLPTPTSARYATALVNRGDVVGVMVELREGRPIRVDGNPRHPSSLGGSDALVQASILELWDPARSRAPRRDGTPSSWAEFETEAEAIRARFADTGDGLRVVSPPIVSPTLARQRDALLARYPQAQWHVLDPAGEATVDRFHDLTRAKVIVTLDADLLGTLPGHLRHARQFAKGRADVAAMSRLYAIEPTPSLTGRNADHVVAIAAAQLPAFAIGLAMALGVDLARPAMSDASGDVTDPRFERVIDAVAADLLAHRAESLIVAGPYVPASVRALADAMNAALGNEGATVTNALVTDAPDQEAATLIRDMREGRVDTVIALDSNPAFALPGFSEALPHVRQSIHLGMFRDETAECCHWQLPLLHTFESWSDLRAPDGSVSIVQPVIAPLVDGRSAHAVVDVLLGGTASDAREQVRSTWAHLSDEDAWDQVLRDGSFPDPRQPGSDAGQLGSHPAAAEDPTTRLPSDARTTGAATVEVVFRPDEWVWDGRYADNAWLQELPRTVTSMTWGNAALVSPALAALHGLVDGDLVRLAAEGRSVETPVLVVPGQAEKSVTLLLGHGRRTGLAMGIGRDVQTFRADAGRWSMQGVVLTALGRNEPLAVTQPHQDMGRRDVVRAGTPSDPPRFSPPTPPASFYPERPAGEYRWGMNIDLNACIGCNACTVACQAENNIPVVGKDEVIRGRRMHWIRVDRYHEGAASAPRTYHQPVPCMHCEHAPCEVVCPVEATVHDSEGLNLQVYNRCIGTRFCSNNCPYKVRRFNFLAYADFASESLKAMRNPEVTVRSKGVMEKCTYCVQRIERAHIVADRDGRRIADGEVSTACQIACPAGAIVFGDLANPDSAVSALQASERRYRLLEELNTRPRTSYLAALRNPNPAWIDA
jgi:molybdopterin-containing oxidoreductase family iron-sulfur binding subunit